VTSPDVVPPRISTAIALIVAAVALVVASAVEFAPEGIRGDADNPADSIAFLRSAGAIYGYSGAALVAGGSALIVGVLGVARIVRAGGLSLAFGSATAFGVLSGGFLAVAGVLRLNSTGTVVYIADLDPGWGESAYLAVQLAGTQGVLATGILALSGWLVAIALVGVRRRLPGLLAVGIPAALILVVLTIDAVAPGLALADFVFPIYILAITGGLPLALLALGATVVPREGTRRLATREPS
jgi:hypothetical protein